MRKSFFSKNAFTLIEILITVIIIGIIASIAFTNFGTVIEKSRAREAEMTAREVLASHKRYAIEHEGVYASSQSSLDFTPRTSEYFNSPQSVSFTDSNGSCVFVLVSRKGGSGPHGGTTILTGCGAIAMPILGGTPYSITLYSKDPEGFVNIGCYDTNGLCAKLGY